ncbi:MAG: DNA helicase RecQ [Muribaculaceae bacterium]|nr:DNA helicase RecQ [Muribaculaceae bacterium]
MDATQLKPRALDLLKKFYGYTSFRPGQWEVISAWAAGRDTFVIMPTGGGKSMCYQMPALLGEGCVVVISPLIALMEDQTAALQAAGIPAAAIHTGRDEMLNRRDADAALKGLVKIIYVSPERFLSDAEQWIGRLPISLIAIDEAHCISQWGHDFRPVYTQLSTIKSRFPGVPLMALTATADRETRDDIARQLSLESPLCWLGSFNRPNLSLTVVQQADARRRMATIEQMIKRYPTDTGIVYTLSRDGAEKVHAALVRKGYRSAVYHAGMSADAREKARRAFSDGDVQVVCATIAFGMGIDKSNIRWVVHNNMPGTIESYYQEIGRAGRDGMPSETVLFYSLQDLIMRRRFAADSGRPVVAAEKLERMKEYAEAGVCRRRVLLNYFGETAVTDCGNCDVCLDPPERIDGTVLVQKAASAVIRTENRVGAFMLADILCGNLRPDIRRRGFDRIKTFGAGRDLSVRAWNHYILQMVQLGLLDVSLVDGGTLSVTPYGMQVVRGEARVELALYRPMDAARPRKTTAATVALNPDKMLFERLKAVRREVARETGIPAYMVFSDSTLNDMAARRPYTRERLLDVSGVGEAKARRFGKRFIDEIKKFDGR